MDISQASDDFYRFLDSIKEEILSPKVFLEEYEASVLAPGTYSPFSDFVGPRDRTTIIFSKHRLEEAEESMKDNSDALEELELIADLSLNTDIKTEQGSSHVHNTTHDAVDVGRQSLESSRVYLTQPPLCDNNTPGAVKKITCAQDNGLSPLPLNSARLIASLYALNCRKAESPLPDIWIVCERNNRNITALGCAHEYPSLLTFTVEEEEKDASEKSGKVKVGSPEKPLKNLVGTAFSEFYITRISTETESSLSELKIQFSWKDPGTLLSPPPESSEAVLVISNLPGDIFSPVLPLYNELRSLYRLCQISKNELNWSDSKATDEGIISSENKKSALEFFLEELAHPLTSSLDATVMSPTSDSLIYEPRKDMDLAERLWMYCHEITSFSELQFTFAEIFKAVLLGKIQPFIHRKSTSTLAGLLRQVLLTPDGITLQDVAVKLQMMLSEARLLPCLIQLGIDKLKRDYQAFFIGVDICSASQLDKFLAQSSSSSLDQCLDLCKLHCVLELDVSIMKVLTVPSSVLSGFTKVAMEVFNNEIDYQPFARSPLFSLPLPPYSQALKSVVALCSKLSPATWCVTTGRETAEGYNNISYLVKDKSLFHCHGNTCDENHFYKCYYQDTAL